MNPVAYAETKLGVHEICNATVEARTELDKIYTIIAEHRDSKRRLERDMEDLEMEISIDERGKHPEMSQAQMDRHLKMVFYQNEGLKEARDTLAEVIDALDGAEFDRRLQEKTIDIGVARMTELGGYLNYLAAAKNASTATVKPSKTHEAS